MPPDRGIQQVGNRPPRTFAKALGRFRGNPVLLRKVFLRTAVAAVAVTIVITVILAALALTAHADLADRMAEAGAVFTGATLLLAIIAAVVALLAYAVSTGLPDLWFKVEVKESAPNNLVFEAIIDDKVGLLAKTRPLRGNLYLRNLSGYSANNPAVIIRLYHMVFRCDISTGGGMGPNRIRRRARSKAIQWDGGPAYSIHGNSVRRLPDFPLGFLWYTGEDGSKPMITVEALAEGYKKVRSIPVDFYSRRPVNVPAETMRKSTQNGSSGDATATNAVRPRRPVTGLTMTTWSRMPLRVQHRSAATARHRTTSGGVSVRGTCANDRDWPPCP